MDDESATAEPILNRDPSWERWPAPPPGLMRGPTVVNRPFISGYDFHIELDTTRIRAQIAELEQQIESRIIRSAVVAAQGWEDVVDYFIDEGLTPTDVRELYDAVKSRDSLKGGAVSTGDPLSYVRLLAI